MELPVEAVLASEEAVWWLCPVAVGVLALADDDSPEYTIAPIPLTDLTGKIQTTKHNIMYL
ncbi:hypothetical protein [Geitlerinema sp. PCC 9228]|jgi:hypothetical protein|uniref:hypothetical protein n=1 Tax=Geitlerinema sp. PCC 9228 TaxID=111611 RepID=UPI0008F9B4FB|nr:hypothetical protein [Geitlerinema sp. PCC 9228]